MANLLTGWSCWQCGAPSIADCADYKICAYLRLNNFAELSEVRPDLLDMERLSRDLAVDR